MSQAIPVKFRYANRTVYRTFATFTTFEEAAKAVQKLRQREDIGWAYIPDGFAPPSRAAVEGEE